jgi:hypothetical protein
VKQGRIVFAVLAAAGVSSLASEARAVIIAQDSFESYAAGSQLNGQTGGSGFSGAYVVPSALQSNVTVVNQSLNYAGGDVVVNGGSRAVRVTGAADSSPLISRSFAAQTGSPVYFSFLYNTNTTAEAFLQFGLANGAAGEPQASVGLQGIAGSGGGAEGFFARVPNAGTTTFATSGINANQTYFVVGRISQGSGSSTYNVVDLFVNPTSLNESTPTLSATAAANTGVSTFDNFMLRTARTDVGSLYNFDQLTIGTTFADVVPIPEPTTAAAAAAGVGLLLIRRRRTV